MLKRFSGHRTASTYSLSMPVSRTVCLRLALPSFVLLVSLEPGHFLLDRSIQSRLELGPVTKMKQNLQPDEEGSQEDRLDKVIKQRWGSSFEDTVPHKLHEPGDDVYSNGNIISRHAIR